MLLNWSLKGALPSFRKRWWGLSNVDKVKQWNIAFKVSLFRQRKKSVDEDLSLFIWIFYPELHSATLKRLPSVATLGADGISYVQYWMAASVQLHVSLPFRSGESDFNVQVFVFRVITPKVRRSAETLLSAERSVFFCPHSTRGFQRNALCMAVLGNNKVLTSLCNGCMCKSSTRGRLFFRENDKNKRC